MIKHCMIAAAALLSANAIASQPVSTLETVMATPMTQGEMAKVEGKLLTLFAPTTSLPTNPLFAGRLGGPIPGPLPSPCRESWCIGTMR